MWPRHLSLLWALVPLAQGEEMQQRLSSPLGKHCIGFGHSCQWGLMWHQDTLGRMAADLRRGVTGKVLDPGERGGQDEGRRVSGQVRTLTGTQ